MKGVGVKGGAAPGRLPQPNWVALYVVLDGQNDR
jgi:hypothetical protein